jgi:flagellar export protein FliJ
VANLAVAERNRVILGLMSDEDAAKHDLRTIQSRAIDVHRLRRTGEYLVSLDRLLQREYEVLQGLVKVEMEKRKVLAEAHQGVRVLERFRERKARDYRMVLDREERKVLDEIGQNLAKGA